MPGHLTQAARIRGGGRLVKRLTHGTDAITVSGTAAGGTSPGGPGPAADHNGRAGEDIFRLGTGRGRRSPAPAARADPGTGGRRRVVPVTGDMAGAAGGPGTGSAAGAGSAAGGAPGEGGGGGRRVLRA